MYTIKIEEGDSGFGYTIIREDGEVVIEGDGYDSVDEMIDFLTELSNAIAVSLKDYQG